MALVRISSKLLEDVRAEIARFSRKLADTTIHPKYPKRGCRSSSTPEIDGPLLAAGLDFAWKGYEELRRLMPYTWKGSTRRLDVALMHAEGDMLVELYACSAGGRVTDLPPLGSNTGGSYFEVRIPYEAWSTHPILEAYGRESKEHADELAAHNGKFKKVDEQVIGFLRGAKSLNDAVNKYPDIKMWIPKEYLVKLDEVVVRSTPAARQKAEAAEALQFIDTDVITSMGVMKTVLDR